MHVRPGPELRRIGEDRRGVDGQLDRGERLLVPLALLLELLGREHHQRQPRPQPLPLRLRRRVAPRKVFVVEVDVEVVGLVVGDVVARLHLDDGPRIDTHHVPRTVELDLLRHRIVGGGPVGVYRLDGQLDVQRGAQQNLGEYATEGDQQLQPGDTLDERGVDDILDEGYSPPEKWSVLEKFGNTAEEEREGESLEQKLAEEEPDPALAYDDDDDAPGAGGTGQDLDLDSSIDEQQLGDDFGDDQEVGDQRPAGWSARTRARTPTPRRTWWRRRRHRRRCGLGGGGRRPHRRGLSPRRPQPAPSPEVRCAERGRSARLAAVGYVDLNAIVFDLPDGRRLLDEVTFRVGEGVKVALVGPNGAGKTTLLRIVAGDIAPHDGAVTRSGGLGVMRQFIGNGPRRARRSATCCCPLRPQPIRRQRRPRSTRAELAMMERDDEPTQMRYAQALADWARRRRLRGRDALGRLHGRGARHAVRAGPVARGDAPCPAASRSGWCSRRCCAARTRCCCSTSRTTISTCRPSGGSRTSCASRRKTVLFVSHDRELLAARRPGSSPSSPAPAGRRPGPTAAGSRPTTQARRGPDPAAGGAAPALGRGARQAQGAGADVQGRRRPTTTAWPAALAGGGDPAGQVRGGRTAGGAAARAEGDDAARAAAGPASGRSSASGWS